jgi:hypothetical protein
VSAWFVLGWKSSLNSLAAGTGAGALVWLICGFAAGQQELAQTAKLPAAPPTCATCHAGVVASYAHAAMHHALESPGANPVLEKHPKLSFQIGQYAYTVLTKDGQSTYTVSDGTDSLTLPIRWMFGQHSQTWVLEKDGNMYESLVSYFHENESLGATPADGELTPHNLTEAIGRKLDTTRINRCFNCHASNAVDGVQLTLDKLTPGLNCERCHEGAQQHMADAARDNFTTLPRKLGTMDAQDAANFCGQCHRTWDTVVRNGWKGVPNVRFQPYRLENSKCFTGDDRRTSCLACHDPHQKMNHNLASYDSKCLACHAEAKVSNASSATRTCPVAKANCVSCHMPKVQLPGIHARFTDHMIRVVKAGEAYPD